MKKSKEQRRLQASNAAHKKLENRAAKRGTDLGEQKRIYHGACIVRQEKCGRVLTRAEREKVYEDVIRNFW